MIPVVSLPYGDLWEYLCVCMSASVHGNLGHCVPQLGIRTCSHKDRELQPFPCNYLTMSCHFWKQLCHFWIGLVPASPFACSLSCLDWQEQLCSLLSCFRSAQAVQGAPILPWLQAPSRQSFHPCTQQVLNFSFFSCEAASSIRSSARLFCYTVCILFEAFLLYCFCYTVCILFVAWS